MAKNQRTAIPKKLHYLHRRVDTRKGSPVMLVVCEGEATEPRYFNAITKHLRLAAVTVRGARGSAPMTVVQDAVEAKTRREEEARESPSIAPYDQVWCVFDVDQHPKMKDALAFAEKHQINVALSNPCFEFWILLHFERFATTNQSRKQIRRELNRHIPEYCKSTDYSSLLLPRLDSAVTNSAHIWMAQWGSRNPTASNASENNPSTLVHKLIACLKPR